MKQDLEVSGKANYAHLPPAWENADRIYDRETKRLEALKEKFTKRRLARKCA